MIFNAYLAYNIQITQFLVLQRKTLQRTLRNLYLKPIGLTYFAFFLLTTELKSVIMRMTTEGVLVIEPAEIECFSLRTREPDLDNASVGM